MEGPRKCLGMQWGEAEQIATWLWQVATAATGNQCEGRLKRHLSTLPFFPECSLTGLMAAEGPQASGSEGGSFRRSPCSRKGFVAPPRLLFRPQHQPLNSDTCCLSFFPQTTGLSALQALSPDQPCMFSAPGDGPACVELLPATRP